MLNWDIYFFFHDYISAFLVVFMCAQEDNFRNIMIRAHHNGMTSGDYVFIDPNFISNDDHYRYRSWYKNDSDDVISREAFRHVIHVMKFKLLQFIIVPYVSFIFFALIQFKLQLTY